MKIMLKIKIKYLNYRVYVNDNFNNNKCNQNTYSGKNKQ